MNANAELGGRLVDAPMAAEPTLVREGPATDPGVWPRITLVTAVLNSTRYLEQTIQSVLSQGYPNLEYIIVDGGSTDGTVDTIRKYERHLAWWVSEPDKGMYDAINRGFRGSSGEIMGWISATDMLHIRSLFVVGSVFRAFPEVEWITGLPTGFNELGMTIDVSKVPRWSRFRFLAGANRYIQQESTFWRRSLWERAGGYVDASRRDVSDFELWVRFFRYARLHPVNALVGGFRVHPDSTWLQNIDEAHRRHDEIIRAELDTVSWGGALRIFRRMSNEMQRIPIIRAFWWYMVMRNLYRLPGPDWPAVIVYAHGKGWMMSR